MIEPTIDQNGRIVYMSFVAPITDEERAALQAALRRWKSEPVVWRHSLDGVPIIQLEGRHEPDIEDTP